MDAGNNNGDGQAQDVKLDTLVLTYNRATDHLDIAGKFNSIDLGLDMLARATRILEGRWRMEQIAALQQAAAAQALAARLGMAGKR